jgi:hypothetical protein
MDCYIYYKAKTEDAKKIQVCVGQLHTHILESLLMSGKAAMTPFQLQRRPVASNGVHTWMEIYRDIPTSFEDIVHDAAVASGIHEHLIGERRLEYFIDA